MRRQYTLVFCLLQRKTALSCTMMEGKRIARRKIKSGDEAVRMLHSMQPVACKRACPFICPTWTLCTDRPQVAHSTWQERPSYWVTRLYSAASAGPSSRARFQGAASAGGPAAQHHARRATFATAGTLLLLLDWGRPEPPTPSPCSSKKAGRGGACTYKGMLQLQGHSSDAWWLTGQARVRKAKRW